MEKTSLYKLFYIPSKKAILSKGKGLPLTKERKEKSPRGAFCLGALRQRLGFSLRGWRFTPQEYFVYFKEEIVTIRSEKTAADQRTRTKGTPIITEKEEG